MAHDVRLVVFGLGRVLIRICDDWQHACEAAGLPPLRTDLSPETTAALQELTHRSDTGLVGIDDFAAAASKHFGLTPADVRAISDAYLRGPYPGTVALLDDLAKSGVPTACLSNTNASHWSLMTDPAGPNYLPLERLTYRFASHLIGARKPGPTIYEHVERATSVPGEAIVFFDDLATNVEAAKARNWRAVLVAPAEDPPAQARDLLRDVGVLP